MKYFSYTVYTPISHKHAHTKYIHVHDALIYVICPIIYIYTYIYNNKMCVLIVYIYVFSVYTYFIHYVRRGGKTSFLIRIFTTAFRLFFYRVFVRMGRIPTPGITTCMYIIIMQ